MAACHHHDHAGATPSELARSPLTVRADNCCDGHECCRSMVRTFSANVGQRAIFAAIDRTEDHVPPQYTFFLNRDFFASHTVRGPPAL
jgi:hypothetical protein